MRDCDVVFLIGGVTGVPLVQTYLKNCRGAQELGDLPVPFPAARGERTIARAKLLVAQTAVGLFAPGGDTEALEALRLFATEICKERNYQQIHTLVFVRDLDNSNATQLHDSFRQSMDQLASNLGVACEVQRQQPATVQIGSLTVAQILFGDVSLSEYTQHMLEDHLLLFLADQPERDPSRLKSAVEAILRTRLKQKQQMYLSMVLDDYWSAPRGFYERIVESTPAAKLEEVARSIGLSHIVDGFVRPDAKASP